jgi:putative cofactor-binding repeat protein
VHALTRYAALTHAADRVRVNAVLPGNIYTPIHDRRRHDALVQLMDGDDLAFESDPLDSGDEPISERIALLDEFRRIHPMGRLAGVDDIAEAARYLASDAAAAVTGNELLVTGGIMAAQLSDRLRLSLRASKTPVASFPEGTVALISGNLAVVDAVREQFERVGRPVAALTNALAGDPTAAVRWLRQIEHLAGVVFCMRPDPGGDLFNQGPPVWDAELSADFRVPWAIAQAARHMLPPGGAVTFIADAAGLTGALASPAYCASAAALTYATDDLADSLVDRGIRLNTIVTEALSHNGQDVTTLGAPASKPDVAALALTLTQTPSLSGLQLSLQTSHSED